ncbi:MAG TPA: SDR family NAD(P)-dependent oxidoreductase [Mycobacteriales bacterium]|nr:SDR family NAD(P)-dependent oxidoreductase [Mycobacteriales bacterium]
MAKALVPSFAGDELAGGVAVVTGAGVGLGRAEALALAAAGAKVVVNDIGDNAEAVAAEIRAAGGEAVGVPGDIGDWEFATSLVRRAIDEYGDLHVLVNNAGVLRDRMIFGVTADEWDTVLRVHLRGHAATCQAATAYWREASKAADGPVWARVVNTASEAFLFGSPGQPNYAAAKAGIAALTLSVAHGCARYGVRANAIAPRARTGMTEALFPSAPEGDEIDPWAIEHIAPVVVWLATRGTDHVNGNVFVTYGGKVGVMKAPALDAAFASDGETWTVAELEKTVGNYLADGNRHTFAVGNDLTL